MPFIIFLVTFGILLSKLYGALSPYRDSGDLAAAAYSLGIAHPPGYCLYTLITKSGILLFPFGNIAYRANFFSALWTSLSCGLLFNILRRFAGPMSSLLCVLIWFLSPSVFRLSIVSEMYSLNALICCIILYLVLQSPKNTEITGPDTWGKLRNDVKIFCLSSFLLGLGTANHPTLIFLIPALAVLWLQPAGRHKFRDMVRHLSLIFLFGLLGFSLVIFYPVRSSCFPLIDWGHPAISWGAREPFRNLWRVLTRSDYGGLKLHPEESHFSWSAGGIADQGVLFIKTELNELRWWGTLLFVVGIIAALTRSNFAEPESRRDAPEIFASLSSFIVAGPVFFLLSNLPVHDRTTPAILEPYLVMTNIFALPVMAMGAKNLIRAGKYMAPLLLIISAIFSFPGSRRREFNAYDYGNNLLKTMPSNSSIYDPDDVTAFSLSYLQVAERKRPDVVPLMTLRTLWGYEQVKRRVPGIVPKGDFHSAQEFIPALLSYQKEIKRPLLSDHPSKFPPGIPSFPVGLLVQAGEIAKMEDFLDRQNILRFYTERSGGTIPVTDRAPEFFTYQVISRMSSSLNNIGIVLQNGKKYAEAETYFRQALLRQPDLSQAWNNLALNQEKLGNTSGAEKAWESALKLDPGNVAAMNELGLMFMNGKKWDQAKSLFENCLKLNRDYSAAHYNLGLLYNSLGQRRESATEFTQYLLCSPDAPDKLQVQQWIQSLNR